MTDHMPDDLSAAGRDLRAYTDELRPRHPVVRNVAEEWVLLRHPDVAAAALDHERFSGESPSSRRYPTGWMAISTRYREVIERHLSHEALAPSSTGLQARRGATSGGLTKRCCAERPQRHRRGIRSARPV